MNTPAPFGRVALAISGPTAIGKTALAMAVADELPARLISVDSAMVFRHMNIGTAKPTVAELESYPHALIDLIEPTANYSAADFVRDARSEVELAWEADQLPVFVGGTMLYFQALRDGLAEMPDRDAAVREDIERAAREKGLPALHAELAKLDAEAAIGIDPNNHQRIVRALEVYRLTGKPISSFWATAHEGLLPGLGGRLFEHALVPKDRTLLHDRINQRFEAMLRDGFVEEVQALWARGDLKPDMTSLRCVGYRQLLPFVRGECSLAEATERGQAATRQLAKRQLTWLRGWDRAGLLQCWESADDPCTHLPAILKQVAGDAL